MKHYFVNCFWTIGLGFTIGEGGKCIKLHNFPNGFDKKLIGLTYEQIDNIFKTKLPHYSIGGEGFLMLEHPIKH